MAAALSKSLSDRVVPCDIDAAFLQVFIVETLLKIAIANIIILTSVYKN